MKIVITGGMGFLGNQIAREILRSSRAKQIIAVGRSKSPPKTKLLTGVDYVASDLSEKNNPYSWLKGTDTLFHVAAKAGIGVNFKEFHKANYLATKYLLDASKAMGVKRFIYTSTPSVVFNDKSIRGDNESLPYTKNSNYPYAFTKAMAEKAVLKAHIPGNFQTIALRPHLIWGKADSHLLPRVIARHRKNKLRIVGEGKNKVDLTHVINVVHGHLCACQSMEKNDSLGGQAYFLGQNEPVFLWDWLNELFKNLGLPTLKKKISSRKAYLIGLIMEKLWQNLRLSGDPPMTRFVAGQLSHDHWFSCKSAEADLGYKPIISMEKAMHVTLPWLKTL